MMSLMRCELSLMPRMVLTTSLCIALSRLDPKIPVELHFQPFELNPQMPPEGEDATEHLSRKYGAPPEQLAALYK